MKKLFFVSFVLILLTLLLYIMIPNKISINETLTINANHEAAYRTLTNLDSWHKWWPGNEKVNNPNKSSAHFSFNGNIYSINDKMSYSLVIGIDTKQFTAKTIFNIFPFTSDSIKLNWIVDIPVSYNPIKRVQEYLDAKKIETDINNILKIIASFISKDENIYGIAVTQKPVIDSILVSTFDNSKGYPSTQYIYNLISELKIYIANNGAKETGFPMLNILTPDSTNYLTRVAIPVDKKLNNHGKISYKGMLGGGKILIAEVKGDSKKVNIAMKQMEDYLRDHHYVAPAIPFLSLVTDRTKEKDSSKWITRIYCPIM